MGLHIRDLNERESKGRRQERKKRERREGRGGDAEDEKRASREGEKKIRPKASGEREGK